MYLRDCFALKPFRNCSLCSVYILPQPAFYFESAVCILHSLCILPLVRSLQSAVRSLRFTLTGISICLLNVLLRVKYPEKKKKKKNGDCQVHPRNTVKSIFFSL